MVGTAGRRLPALEPGPPARVLAAAIPVVVRVSTVVVRSGTAILRAAAFWISIAAPRPTISASRKPATGGLPLSGLGPGYSWTSVAGAAQATPAPRPGPLVIGAWRHPGEGRSPPGPDLRRPASCVRDVTWSLRNTLRR